MRIKVPRGCVAGANGTWLEGPSEDAQLAVLHPSGGGVLGVSATNRSANVVIIGD